MKKILIIGTGSIGLRHYKVAGVLGLHPCLRSSSRRREEELELKGFRIAKQCDQYCLGIVANSADMHLDTLRANYGIAATWLCEKPLLSIHNNYNTADLEWLSRRDNVFVGYNKRLEGGIIEMKKMLETRNGVLIGNLECYSNLLNWRRQTITDSISLNRSRGGGVVNELSHEIDLAWHLLGKGAKDGCLQYRCDLSLRFVDAAIEDTSMMVISFPNGNIATVGISFGCNYEHRTTTITSKDARLQYDHNTGVIEEKGLSDTTNEVSRRLLKESRNKSFKRQLQALLGDSVLREQLCSARDAIVQFKSLAACL